jgi:hypothetical protein
MILIKICRNPSASVDRFAAQEVLSAQAPGKDEARREVKRWL